MRALAVFLAILAVAAAFLLVDVEVEGPRVEVVGPPLVVPGPDAIEAAVHGETEGAPTVETLVSGLDTPWDLVWGPDGQLWVSERAGRIWRVDPGSGERTLVGEVEVTESGESGLMGLAFHPEFGSEPWVYAAHSYRRGGGIRNRLVRMRYDGTRLGPPEPIFVEIPGNRVHDGSRLGIGPDGYLYMTTGDAGEPDHAQDLESTAGKILRLGLDGRPAPGNPSGTAVYSYGHRNPQGLDFHPATARLYSSEHGPSHSDEVNLIREGGNYGWPSVLGACDGGSARETAFCEAHEVVEPLAEWTPPVGLSGLAVYASERIPAWSGSLLVTSLTGRTLFRLALSADGSSVIEREALYREEFGRLRDVLVSPDGLVYLATSNRDGRGRPAETDDRILRIRP